MKVARAKRLAARILERYPLYRLIPVPAVRRHAATIYHSRRPWEEFADFVRSVGIATSRLSSGRRAAQAAFRAGYDDLLAPALTALEQRFPRSADIHELWSGLHEYRGDYDDALRSAVKARKLRPRAASAAARVVRLTYHVKDQETADSEALAVLRQFPLAPPVLSAVCRGAQTPEQFDRVHGFWRERISDQAKLTRAVRPLALGALRTGQVELARDLSGEAIRLVATGAATAKPIAKASLAGRGAWTAIQDLCAAFERAGLTFFFAAGTALGLVREGRPLPGDDDIDVGVLESDWDRDRIIEVFVRDPRFLVNSHPDSPKIGLTHRGGARVDIFRFHEEAGRVWHDGVFVRWHNSPFTVVTRDLNGVKVPLPEDADRYLTENYGDWRTPNPGFDAFTDDAPNVEITWPEYLRVHLVR